jgi:hypothetical protein
VPQTYKIDQAATFAGVVLLSVEPKLTFGSTDQDRTHDGVPKWEAQLATGFHQFRKVNNNILKAGVVGRRPDTRLPTKVVFWTISYAHPPVIERWPPW